MCVVEDQHSVVINMVVRMVDVLQIIEIAKLDED